MKQNQLPSDDPYDRYNRLCAFNKGLRELVKEPMEPGDRLKLFNYIRSTDGLISRIERILSIEVIGDYNNSFLIKSKYNPGDNYEIRDKIRRQINKQKYFQKYKSELYAKHGEKLRKYMRTRYYKMKSDPERWAKLMAYQKAWRERKNTASK